MSDAAPRRVERDLAEHERPVVGKHLVQRACGRTWRCRAGRRATERRRRVHQRGRSCSTASPAVAWPSAVPVPEAGPGGLGEVAGGDDVALVVDLERAAGAATGPPGRTPAGRRRARRTSTGGTGTAAGAPRPGRARPGSRRGCRSSSRRRGRPASSPPGRVGAGSCRSGRISSVGASAASVWPSGKTVTTPSTAMSSARMRLIRVGDQAHAVAVRRVLEALARARARASGWGTAAQRPECERRPPAIFTSRPRRARIVLSPLELPRNAARSPPRSTRADGAPRSTVLRGMKCFAHTTMPTPMPPRARARNSPSSCGWPPASRRPRGPARPTMLTPKQAAVSFSPSDTDGLLDVMGSSPVPALAWRRWRRSRRSACRSTPR